MRHAGHGRTHLLSGLWHVHRSRRATSISGSLCHLIEEGCRFTDLFLELPVVSEISLDLLQIQVDKHTCDLGSKCRALELLHKVENGISDLHLHVGVFGLD